MPFKKGNPGRPVGSKNGTTLLREERRAMFDQWASDNWMETMKRLKAEYVADQFLGKAPDISKVEVSDTRELSAEEVAMLAEIVKRKKLSE